MDLRNKTIAVTGASGFLGSYIALELLAQGANVRAVVRSPEKAQWLAEKGCTFAKADLEDRAALTEAFRGVDAVVTNAALYTLERKSWDEFLRPNKTGTENAFDAAADAGIKRIVHVSTCGVYRPSLGTVREDAPRLLEKDKWWYPYYPVSKAISEDIAWERAKRYEMDLTVVRPGGIYGPRDFQSVPQFVRFMAWPVMFAPWIRIPMSHGADIAHGIRGALENDATIGKAYNLAGEWVGLSQIMYAWKKHSGKGPLLLPLPLPFGPYFDSTAAKRDLGFSNRSVDDTVKDIVANLG